MLRVVVDESSRAELAADLDEIAREGARRMLAMALEAEVEAYLAAFIDERDDAGRRQNSTELGASSAAQQPPV